MNQNLQLISDKIKEVIEKRLLVDVSRLKNDDDLELTLGIDHELDMPILISEIEQTYELSSEAKELLLQSTTLNQLASIVMEETELG